ncbi:MAG: PEP-CTERM sorting domain-containing protein [Chroococcales cyanobacterium]
MKLQKLSTCVGLIAGSAIAFSGVNAAQAASFSASDANAAGCVGATTCTVNDFFTLDGSGDEMTYKTVGGFSGIGLQGVGATSDQSEGEIDVDEFLKVTFEEQTILSKLGLNFLYQPGVFSDDVFEVAEVSAFDSIGNILQTATLTITGDTTAIFSNGATVENVSPSKNNKGGYYNILNPFADLEIAGFSLTPVDDPNVESFHDSDFALAEVETVPEPGTLAALLGIGALGGLTKLRRRQKDA